MPAQSARDAAVAARAAVRTRPRPLRRRAGRRRPALPERLGRAARHVRSGPAEVGPRGHRPGGAGGAVVDVEVGARRAREMRCPGWMIAAVPWAGEAAGSLAAACRARSAPRALPLSPSGRGRWTTTARPAPTRCTSRSWARDRTWRRGRAADAAGSSGCATRVLLGDRPRPCSRHRPATPGPVLAPGRRRVRRRRASSWAAGAWTRRPGPGPDDGARPTRGGGADRSGPGTPPARPGSARCPRRSRRGGTAWPGGDAPCGSRRRSPRAPRRAPGRDQGSGAWSSDDSGQVSSEMGASSKPGSTSPTTSPCGSRVTG